jgi:hypothetical protein
LQRTVYINQVDGNPLFNSQIKQAGTQADKNSKKNIRFMRFGGGEGEVLPKVKMKR